MVFDRFFLKFLFAGFVNTIVGSCLMFVMYNIFWYGVLGFFGGELHSRKYIKLFLEQILYIQCPALVGVYGFSFYYDDCNFISGRLRVCKANHELPSEEQSAENPR
jgi:hypothetical protein